VNYSELNDPHPIVTFFYMLSSAGHQAVIVFFVLSGYFISNSVINSIRKQTWTWKVYLTNRLTRLYIVLIPALLLGVIWDQVGIHSFGHTGVYDGLPEDTYILGYSAKSLLTWQTFAGSLFYLQGIMTEHFGSNGPLWSLAYEFWYYILFPCLVLAAVSRKVGNKVLYGLLSVILCVFVGKHIVLYFLIWSLGFAVHLLPVRKVPLDWVWKWLLPLLVIGSVFGHRFIPFGTFIADLLIAVSFAAWIYYMKCSMLNRQPSPGLAVWAKRLAGFSYTSYLTHFPLLVWVHAALFAYNPVKWQPTAESLIYGISLLAITLIYSWLISLITERHTDKVRKRLTSLLTRKNKLASQSTQQVLEKVL
jgi:peptidoglycan/LPS O-acetylase OafA/YrhL